MSSFLAHLLACAALLALVPTTSAQAPRMIPYQGVLADGGTPVTTATDLTFRLYDAATGGTELWTETQTVTPDGDGAFGVQLGAVTALDAVVFDAPLWLAVEVDGTALGPRTALGAAPYALGLYGVRVTPPTPFGGYGPSVAAGLPLNTASGAGAVVAGGGYFTLISGERSNTASGTASVVSGGQANTASGTDATVGGGYFNTASGPRSTVGGGGGNIASGLNATVGGGQNNIASGSHATVAGGEISHARGENSFAAGYNARAAHDGTFVWSHDSNSFADSLVSTGPNQFLVRAPGGVGIGTNAPLAQIHVETLDLGLSSAALLNEDLVAEASDAVVGLYSDPNGTWGSAVTLGEINTSGDLTSKWAMVRETMSAGGSLYFTFKSGPGSENYGANFPKVRFDIDGTVHAGTYSSSGADLAEYFPLADGAAAAAGQVVGLRGGRVSLTTDGAEQIAVISSNPAFVGNPDAADGGALVALVGQVEVHVSGDAAAGDLLIASGAADGRARAVSPAAYVPADGAVLGRVLSAEGSRVVALVGVDEAAAIRAVAQRQHDEIRALRADRDRHQAESARQAAEIDALRAEMQAIRDALAPRAAH